MQHSGEHNGVRLCSDAPVVGSFQSGGRTILTLCRRNLDDAIRDMKLLVEIVPQNVATFQGGNHAIPVDVVGAVSAGAVVYAGDNACGEAGR